MKPTLKTTALAMCIALSLTACKSTSNSGDARPTPVQPEAAKAKEAA
ncbi:putative lipoprotein, partial [Haemophilus haemolyticus HK386]